MTLLEKYERYVKLWRVALPHISEPSIQDAARWADYPPEIVEKAILRTARRFAVGKIPPTFQSVEAHKYATSVAKGEINRMNNPTPTTEELIEAVKALEFPPTQATIDLLVSGEIGPDSSIADVGTALKKYNSPATATEAAQ